MNSKYCKTCIFFDHKDHCGKHVTYTEPQWRCSDHLEQDNRTSEEVTNDIKRKEAQWTPVFGNVTNIDKNNKELLHPVDIDPVFGSDSIHGDRESLLDSTFGMNPVETLDDLINNTKVGDYKIDSAGNLKDISGPMTIEKYNAAIDEQIERCTTLLTSKRGEYATDVNPLNNFNRAGDLLYKTPVGALSGMMAKHTISVYDMMNDHENGIKFTKEKWDEKITDHINYLLILQAILEDERG